jgi:hypothetical protein
VFIAGAVLLAIVLLTWLVLQFFVAQRSDQLQQTEEAVTSLEQQARALAIFEEQRQALEQRQQVATTALDGRIDMGKVLEEISLVLPEPLWLDELTLNQDTGMVASGYTPDSADAKLDESYKSIAAGLVRVNGLDDLYDVWLTTADSDLYADFQGDEAGGENKVVVFESSAKISRPSTGTAESAVPAPPSTAGQ